MTNVPSRRALCFARATAFGLALLHASCAAGTQSGGPTEGAGDGSTSANTPSTGSAQTTPAATDTRHLEAYLAAFAKASAAADPEALASLYAADAEIVDHGRGEVTRGRELADELTDGPLRQHMVRGAQSGRLALVEWVHGGAHPAGPVGVRGASVLTFDDAGKVASETRYVDFSTQMAQIYAGFRSCLPRREPIRIPDDDATSLARIDRGASPDAEPALKAFLRGDTPETVTVSNQMLTADSASEAGSATELTRAFAKRSTAVSRCVSGPTWAACEVERRGDFVAPLLGIKPTGRSGSLHALVVARIREDRVHDVVEYAGGGEFARTYLDLNEHGFLEPSQYVDPNACR